MQRPKVNMEQAGLDDRAPRSDERVAADRETTRMGKLAERYPELGAFTPDATLTEIKSKYRLESLDEVRKLGQRRLGWR
jgi:hypothetical protein